MSKPGYLGKKGYTIFKTDLNKDDEKKILKDLIVKPFIPKSIIPVSKFPVYRESTKKYYLPRFYGIKTFGSPKRIEINDGENINIKFEGTLRDYQYNIVDKYVDYVNDGRGGGLLEIDTGLGKTVIALNILTKLNVKAIIIVHKEFLMNQWIERIEQFIPNARIGKIQGSKIDIENKDIVIGMLQSLSMKDYDSDIFSSFGITVIDEVHHMGAEVFSQALYKVVTKYMLGLSATMERKDGLTDVFKMFIGDIIHTEKRKQENNNVIVRRIDYKVEDVEFNDVKHNFRGDVCYSSMINKLCTYNRRSEFIINLIKGLFKENKDQQILILGHNKSLLTYLHDALAFNNVETIGYYLGGMKQEQLKLSESKKIIIATYQMASEGLDIKSLTTLLMVTPKSDVIQCVGRILRSKHDNPMVIDIVDKHDIFKRQFYKRKKFYNEQKYLIENTSNIKLEENNFNFKNKIIKEDEPNDNPSTIFRGKCLIDLTD
jgi:superfamily II DNA or RNA helicase|tara:strand:+ start:1854 stop:3314 length:1461 start_codon:yes stop_codon:yes gene_type:complete